MNTENNYYNAKPSKISNMGKDVGGAARMRFDTYENPEEKKKRKATNKALKEKRDELRELVSSHEGPLSSEKADRINLLMENIFELSHGFHPIDINEELEKRRPMEMTRGACAHYNKAVNAYNRHRRATSYYRRGYYDHFLRSLKGKYKKREKPVGEETGKTFDWKKFEKVMNTDSSMKFLIKNSMAVQFGNSVTDRERGYICKQLTEFIRQWKESRFRGWGLDPISWSFGARGKPGSVAYYQATGDIISVNRNNIGSIVHEVAHAIDHRAGLISRKISLKTRNEYRDLLLKRQPHLKSDRRRLNYYCSSVELFARAFEKYCLEENLGFSKFAQDGEGWDLPELNDELRELVEYFI